MQVFLSLMVIVLFVGLMVGLVKPSLVKMKSRIKIILLWFFSTLTIFLILSKFSTGEVKRETNNTEVSKKTTLKEETPKNTPPTFTEEERRELDKLKKAQAKKHEEAMNKKAFDIARRDLFQEYMIKKKKVLDAYWKSEEQLWITMFNNGRDRSGYADYICTESRTWGTADKLKFTHDFTIYIYDAVAMNSNKFSEMGSFHCKRPK